jgi:hypothetical protein
VSSGSVPQEAHAPQERIAADMAGKSWTATCVLLALATLLAAVAWRARTILLSSEDILRAVGQARFLDVRERQEAAYVSPVAAILLDFLSKHNCTDVYLDLGSNIGVQVRKLYQPRCFPRAHVLGLFDQAFGTANSARRQAVCTFGFEPNKNHTSKLEKIQQNLQSKGSAVVFFTNTAVAGKDVKNVTFYTDMEMGKKEWGAGLLQRAKGGRRGTRPKIASGNAHVVGLHTILRQIKQYGKIGTLVLKMDIEGSEYDAVPGGGCCLC